MNRLTFRESASAAFGGSILLLAAPAAADPITLDAGSVGTSFSYDYNGFADGNVIDGLTGSTTFTLTGVTPSTYTFDYQVANISDGGVGSRISSFAFDTNPDIDSASSTGTYNYTVLDSNYPNGIGAVDVCFKAGSSNSCAGNSGGVTEGRTGSGTLTLDFGSAVDQVTLDNFFVRYQSITGAGNVTSASGEVTSSSTTTSSTSGGTPVPEPGMLVLFGFAAAGAAFFSRRRKPLLGKTVEPAFA